MKTSLTIAGSDTGGGAGIQADLKTFSASGVHGLTVVTSLTAQNSLNVAGTFPIPADFILVQLNAVYEDFTVDSVKTGMLLKREAVENIASFLKGVKNLKLVIDPVMVSSTGKSLLDDDAIGALKKSLIPLATVVTPNGMEASALTGIDVKDQDSMMQSAKAILAMGAKSVIVTGGDMDGNKVTDVFLSGSGFKIFAKERVETDNNHGTGCVFSSAITARLALDHTPEDAVLEAEKFIKKALIGSYQLGHGKGSVNPMA